MSYHSWSVEGYGINISKAVENYDTNKIKKLKKLLENFWNEKKPYADEVFPEAKEYFKKTLSTSVSADEAFDEMFETFNDYENDNGEEGLGFLIAEAFTWLWKKANHDDSIVTITSDYCGTNDVYWLLSTVYPWYKGEFSSEEECKKAIMAVFSEFIPEENIDFVFIEQGA